MAAVLAALTSAKAPILILDGGAARQAWAKHVNPLVNTLKIPVFNTLLGKGVADEYSPYYGGSFAGAGSTPKSVIDAVARADCILWLGNLPSDFNTYVHGCIGVETWINLLMVRYQWHVLGEDRPRYSGRLSALLCQGELLFEVSSCGLEQNSNTK